MIALIGESGSGKSTLENMLVELGYQKSLSFTTRPMRAGEVNGEDYMFITVDDYYELKDKDMIVQDTCFNDNYYGTLKDVDINYNKSVVVIEPGGIEQFRKAGIPIQTFYIKVDSVERYNRMLNRGDTLDKAEQRLVHDLKVFCDAPELVDYIIDGHGTIEEVLKRILNCLED